MTSKWNDLSNKDLTFAVLMSSNDGNFNVKANWEKVEQYMRTWGHDFSKGAMSQQWTKKILKEFRQRHPDNVGNNGDSSAPATPAKKAGASRAPRTPKTPASGKGKGKGKKRAADEDDDEGDTPLGFIADPIAKTKSPRNPAKKVKHEADAEDEDEDEADEDEGVDMQPKPEENDEDYEFALDV